MFDPIANKKIDNLKKEVNNNIDKKFYEINAEKDFTIYLPLGNGYFGGHTFIKETNDDFLKLMGLDVFRLDEYEYISESSTYNSFTGELNTSNFNNHYSTAPGTEVKFRFTGTKIYMNHLVDNRGGMWEAYVDGQKIKNISTYSPTIEVVSTLIVDDLEPIEHEVILRFAGQDPDNPVENPRGWIYHDGKGRKTFDFIRAYPKGGLSMIKEFELIRSGSNIEYAITVANEDNTDSEWIPEHNRIGTVFLGDNGFQELVVDGISVGINQPKGLTSFKSCVFTQFLECMLPEDVENRANLIIKMEFTDVMEQYFEMEFMKNSIIKAGYAFQMPMTGDFLSKIKTDKREVALANYEIVGASELTHLDDLEASEFVATSDKYPDYFLKNVVTNYSEPMKRIWLQHRSADLQKLYPQFFMGGAGVSVEKGYKLYFDGYYKIGRLKNSNKIYS